ncbi:uncharacterized protein A4U43_UnF7180 [Asparagus officinalis]|uniref:DRBM domain-containing protein n=1 Tax=Asparagus officinalis TaxID=4686 RepID=A0A1R3L697_ASPOF|nr:double-stranded RNA-binding protein 1-like [Asparagus officinalis]ONK55143.1 uncharacterized protein A4U43_UnF7180 [Asparagus officinalis]
MEMNAPAKDQGFKEQFMNKNRLQEFAQKSRLPLPVYRTENEGYQHTPLFRSSVTVDGITFTSPNTFLQRKAAEQDAAKLALESLSRKIDISSILEDATFAKSMLHEYAMKMSLEKPTYQTSQATGSIHPMFISSTIFNGQTYTGDPGRNKKEAEQMAARAAIKSILANSDSQSPMLEVIRSKKKLCAAFFKSNSSDLRSERIVPPISHCQINPSYVVSEKEPLMNSNSKLPEIMCSGDEQIAKANAAETFSPEAKKYEEEHTCELIIGLAERGGSHKLPAETVPLAATTSSKFSSSDGEQFGSYIRPENSSGVILASGMKRTETTEIEGNEPKRTRALIPPGNAEHSPEDA